MSSPFDTNHADPWTQRLVDLAELNAHASDGIADAIRRVRDSARAERQDIESASLLVLGPAGAGKTHLFARLRRKIGPRAVFVHLRPLIGASLTPRYVLGELLRQLECGVVVEGEPFRQLDALVGAAFAYLEHESITMPRVQLDEVRQLDDRARLGHIDWCIDQVARCHPEIDDGYARKLLGAPFMATTALRRATLAWLGGRELEPQQLERLGFSTPLPEERLIPALQTLALFATPGTPVVLVFDQLENLMDPAATGERVRAYGSLIAELFDTMRGVVLVQMALDTEWTAAIFPQLTQPQRTRLDSERQVLRLPTAEQKRELVRLWLEQIPDRREPFPAPFGERRVREWCDTIGMTPRMLMVACREALLAGDLAPGPESTPTHAPTLAADEDDAALETAWEEHLQRARRVLEDAGRDLRPVDGARLLGGISTSLRLLPAVREVALDPERPVQVRVDHAERTWGVALVQQVHPRSAGAALDHVSEALRGLPVLAVREQRLDFPPTWKATTQRVARFTEAGGHWLLLQRDDLAKLLALESLVSAARSGDVDGRSGRALQEQAVTAWVGRALSLETWAVARMVGNLGTAEELYETPAAAFSARPIEASAVEACVRRLRVMALDRLVREVARASGGATRAEVVAALDAMKGRVEWFGRAIVALRSDAP